MVTRDAYGQFSSSIWKNGPSPWDICTFKGHLDVNISRGSGISDTQFDILQIEIMRYRRLWTNTPPEKKTHGNNYQLQKNKSGGGEQSLLLKG